MSNPIRDRRILLVDDEMAFARTLAKRIAMRGYPCDIANDGRSGLSRLAEREYLAMLLDLRLPDLPGQSVLPLALDSRPDLPIVIITAHGDETDERECLALGAVAFLSKPIRFDLLLGILADIEADR